MNSLNRLLEEQNLDKHQLVISRHWNNPQISVTVNREKIEVIMSMEEFINCLITELNNEKIVLTTKGKMEKKLRDTAKQVVLKAQEATNQVMV